jgi:esterase/lipase
MHRRIFYKAYVLTIKSVRGAACLAGFCLFLAFGVPTSWAQETESELYTPSQYAAFVPASNLPFDEYVQRTEERLRAVLDETYFAKNPQYFGADYPIERVVTMRAPFEVKSAESNCAQDVDAPRVGFLLIHGLTDSPYYLREVARELVGRVPCATARALLLPGHGTVPGDTLGVTWQDWMATTQYGVESFRSEVDEIYIVGYSMGSTLGLLYADEHREDDFLKGLILLSPAVRANSSLAFLSPYLRWFQDWLDQEEERDAARYESFSVNAAAEFYSLASQVDRYFFRTLDLPIFMAGSIDDGTIDYATSIDFFCDKAPSGKRKMLVYQARTNQVERQCAGMQIVDASVPSQRVFSISHTGVTNSAADTHYGFDAGLRNCRRYGRGTQTYDSCVNDNPRTVYAELNLLLEGELEGKLIRRGSFNPHFDNMLDAIVEFIAR